MFGTELSLIFGEGPWHTAHLRVHAVDSLEKAEGDLAVCPDAHFWGRLLLLSPSSVSF